MHLASQLLLLNSSNLYLSLKVYIYCNTLYIIYQQDNQKSEAIDKLVASGAFTRNEVRKLTGFDTVDDPEMDEFILTKNYETKSDKEEEEPQIKF